MSSSGLRPVELQCGWCRWSRSPGREKQAYLTRGLHVLCQKYDRNDKDTQQGATGEGQCRDPGEKAGGGGLIPEGFAVLHCPVRLSVGAGESCPAGTEPAPGKELLCRAETSSWWEETRPNHRHQSGTGPGRVKAGHSLGFLTHCPPTSPRRVSTLRAWCHLCLRPQGRILRNMCRVPRESHAARLRKNRDLDPSSAKDLILGVWGHTPSALSPAGLSHLLPALCSSSCHLLLLIFSAPPSFCPVVFFLLTELVCGPM